MNLTLSMKPTNSHTPPKQNIGENNFTINEEKLDIIPMFEKIVTPSDVGKLNRLVIPKQHAERHFPRLEQPSAGTLLSFEDCATGESWQFRYSYWGSSQSYVMTKGWSRFVRQKQLSAGDTVYFSSDKHRNCLFISYRHKTPVEIVKISSNTNGHRRKADHRNYDPVYYTPIGKNLQFREKIVADLCSDTNWCCKRSEKRIRLFGVNLEFLGQESNCPPFLDLKL